MNERQEIIILIKKGFLLIVLTTLSIRISVKYTGNNLTKEAFTARQREALPFPLFMLLLIISWRKSYELTKKE
jgi:hypothetical protein